jgi:hypothetical protein
MIKIVLRTLVGTLLGMSAAFVLIVGVEGFSAVVHPTPEDFKGTMEEMCLHVERYPQWVLAAVVPMWAVAALVGTWAAQKIGNVYAAGIVGVLLLAALVLNISMLPYPIWFKVVILLVIPVALVAGGRFARSRKTVGQGEVN